MTELYYKRATNKFMSSFCQLLFIQCSNKNCEHTSVSHCSQFWRTECRIWLFNDTFGA